jgi:quercetin dioxygenase-like cupin family protein
MTRSRVVRGGDAAWPGVPVREYKDDPELYRGVVRRALAGAAAGDAELGFELRSFEVAPGGWTTLERHRHPHAVVVVAGRGEVRLGEASHALAPLDFVFVAPEEAHQFRAAAGERLVFLCVVDRDRDRPRPAREG